MALPKTGKLPKKEDRRNIKLAKIFKKILPPIPEHWDTDSKFSFPIPLEMWGNDELGDCVEVTKFNAMLRFEGTEQSKAVPFTLADVKRNYFRETGGGDTGLVMLDAMKDWRKAGISIGERKILCLKRAGEIYKIHAFAELESGNANELKGSVYLLAGCSVGLILPNSAGQQWTEGKIWDDVGDLTLWAGHAVQCKSYNEIGPIYLTWGKEQQATWKFHRAYNDEAYAIVDAKNKPDSPIDEEALESYLSEIT